ncbi:MAG: LapA family protein [Desulfarculaceae bacterium]|jgi:uncharacterized integral membrane protein
MSYLKALIISAVVALAIIFMVQNIEPLSNPLAIRLNLLFVQFTSTPYPTYLLILLAFFVGLLAASLLGISERFRFRKLIRTQRKEVASLSRELDSLRNLPITSEHLSSSEETVSPATPEEKEALT